MRHDCLASLIWANVIEAVEFEQPILPDRSFFIGKSATQLGDFYRIDLDTVFAGERVEGQLLTAILKGSGHTFGETLDRWSSQARTVMISQTAHTAKSKNAVCLQFPPGLLSLVFQRSLEVLCTSWAKKQRFKAVKSFIGYEPLMGDDLATALQDTRPNIHVDPRYFDIAGQLIRGTHQELPSDELDQVSKCDVLAWLDAMRIAAEQGGGHDATAQIIKKQQCQRRLSHGGLDSVLSRCWTTTTRFASQGDAENISTVVQFSTAPH